MDVGETQHLFRSYAHRGDGLGSSPRTQTGLSSFSGPSRRDTGPIALRNLTHGLDQQYSRLNRGDASPLKIWQVARAATAVEHYFHPLRVDITDDEWYEFTDGALGTMNNPTSVGFSEIQNLAGYANALQTVVSIGTSRSAPQRKKWILSTVKRWINRASDTEVVHQEIERLCRLAQNFTYFRFNRPGGTHFNVDFDEWDPPNRLGRESGSKTVEKFRQHFLEWADNITSQEAMRACAQQLVDIRQARTQASSQWEHFATVARFSCKQCRQSELFNSRSVFEDHLRMAHHFSLAEIDDESKKEPPYTFQYQDNRSPEKKSS